MKSHSPTVIKKYANRRLYHTGTSAYVTLDDLADMVRRGEDFTVQDAKTGEDITRGVLGQIIFDAESRGAGLLPIAFLRQLITFYGDKTQTLVPAYLEHSLATFAREQDKLRKHLNKTIGDTAFDAVEDQVRRNMDLFQRSMRMFMPFPAEPEPERRENDDSGAREEGLARDVASLRGELLRMQQKIDALAGGQEAGPAFDGPSAPSSPAHPSPTHNGPSLSPVPHDPETAPQAASFERRPKPTDSALEDDASFVYDPVKREA